MFNRASSIAAALAASALLLALAATASAAPPDWEEQPRSLRLTLQLPTSNGYEAQLITQGHRRVTLVFVKGGSFAAYRTSGRVSRKGIRADFGPVGSVSLRFRGHRLPRFLAGSGLPRWLFPPRKCAGRKPQRWRGSYHGRIDLKGEHGFTAVEAKVARGELIRTYRRLCEPLGDSFFRIAALSQVRHAAEKPKDINLGALLNSISLNTLTASAHSGGRWTWLTAMDIETTGRLSRLNRKLKPFAVVGSRERREGVLIERGVFTEGRAKSMLVSPPKRRPVSVSLAFPKPLEGEATLLGGKPPSWTGTLLARLPGIGGVALTAPRSSAVLCRAKLLDFVRSPCEREAEEMVPKSALVPFKPSF